jgi:hypothetical protein
MASMNATNDANSSALMAAYMNSLQAATLPQQLISPYDPMSIAQGTVLSANYILSICVVAYPYNQAIQQAMIAQQAAAAAALFPQKEGWLN